VLSLRPGGAQTFQESGVVLQPAFQQMAQADGDDISKESGTDCDSATPRTPTTQGPHPEEADGNQSDGALEWNGDSEGEAPKAVDVAVDGVSEPSQEGSEVSDPERKIEGCMFGSTSTEDPKSVRFFAFEPGWKSTFGSEAHPHKPLLHRMVASWPFETLCSVFILINCTTMGLQAHLEVAQSEPSQLGDVLGVAEHVFTGFFLLEFILRVKVYGYRIFFPTNADGRANFVDAFLVIVTGVLSEWIVPPIALAFHFDSSSPVFRMLQVLRAIRLARLVRVFRKMPIFREAWLLVRGLHDSFRTLFWTLVVIFFVTYSFAIFGLVMIVQPLQQVRKELTDPAEITQMDDLLSVLGGLDRMMFTLLQVLLGDSFHAYIRAVLVYVPFSWMFFYAYIAIATLVLMNLVTAIIVENAAETSRNDHEQQITEKKIKQKRQIKELKHLFTLMDADGSGTLCWEEFQDSFQDVEMTKMWMLLDFAPFECRELFKLLDDGDGEIETNEFFEGLSRMKGPAQSKDVFRLQKTLFKLQLTLNENFGIEPDFADGTESQRGMSKGSVASKPW